MTPRFYVRAFSDSFRIIDRAYCHVVVRSFGRSQEMVAVLACAALNAAEPV